MKQKLQYAVTKNIVQVIGGIWMPYGLKGAMEYTLSDSDLKNYGIDPDNPTRESVSNWVFRNTGDFSSIDDFRADIGNNKVIDWANPDSEVTYNDIMFPLDESET